MSLKRFLATTYITLSVAVISLATTAQAGFQLYSGKIILHGFGNDQTTGSVLPYNEYTFAAHPKGGGLKCNQLTYHPQEDVTLMNHQAGSSETTATFSIPAYGGNPGVVTWYGATPTVSNTLPLFAAGCSKAPAQYGAPLKVEVTEFKSVFTTSTASANARGFSIPQSDFQIQTSGGSFDVYTEYIFGVTEADLKNNVGNFQKGAGPGDFVVQHVQGQANQGRAEVIEGPNRFGGVMQLMGFYRDREGFIRNGHISIANFTWLFDYVGGTPQYSSGGDIVAGNYATAMYQLTSTDMGATGAGTAGVSAFPWTTGAAIITATRGAFPTVMRRTGYDNRDSNGIGKIQMVSPMLTHWDTNGFHSETGSIGILNLVFAPEPQSWMALGAGGSLLALLHLSNRPGRKSD